MDRALRSSKLAVVERRNCQIADQDLSRSLKLAASMLELLGAKSDVITC